MGSRLADELDACPHLAVVFDRGGSHVDIECRYCVRYLEWRLESMGAIEQVTDYDRVWRERFGSGGGARHG